MITDAYAGTYTREGNVVTIKGLANVDAASEYKIPGLWDWIDSATGDAVVTVDDAAGTFVPGAGDDAGADAAPGADAAANTGAPATSAANVFLYEYEGMGGTDVAEITLNEDGTVQFRLKDHPMITDVYAGTYTREGDVVTIKGLSNVDASSQYKLPGLWDWIDNANGDAVITVSDEGTFVPGAQETPAASADAVPAGSYKYEFEGMMGAETAQLDLNEDGTCQFFLPGHPMIKDVYAGTYTAQGNTVTVKGLTNVDATSQYKTPGLWDWIDNATGDAVVTVDAAAGTFAPAE